MRVKLYRNLAVQYRASPARPGYVTWTTLYAEGPKRGLAYRHGDGVVLQDVDFEVSESMRQTTIRMRKEGRTKKTPHAFAVGTPLNWWPEGSLARGLGPADLLTTGTRDFVRVGYDPYTTPHFVREDCGEPVHHSTLAIATPTGLFAKLPPCGRRGISGLGRGGDYVQDPFLGLWV